MMRTLPFMIVLLLFIGPAAAQHPTEALRLNQVGFYPAAPKQAVLADTTAETFYVVTPDFVDTVYTGTFGPERKAFLSGETAQVADFSSLHRPGTYVVWVPGVGYSYPFEVAANVHQSVAEAALKGFYFMRMSTPLPVAYAGVWSRPAGHPDDQVQVHVSAASPERPEGTILAAPKGWYDAGDYNKYIVNSGITTATLLSFYEAFPDYAATLDTNIPERGNALPDILDEVLWNLRWMLAMQDPHDGGVYHKLTTANFEGIVMPAEARAQRYVVQKSTTAALNFAAVTAQAARIFRSFEDAVPGLADSCATAAVRAWNWARRHPDQLYNQWQMNGEYDPDVVTGAYGDRSADDEFVWAAIELYATTRQDSFYTAADLFSGDGLPRASWNQVLPLAYYTLARLHPDLTPVSRDDFARVRERLISDADDLIQGVDTSAYQTVMGQRARDYIWGSSSVAANQGIALIQAYQLTREAHYLHHALTNLDYLLGRNATGYSFVTGYGDKPPMHPHHRPSEADGIRDPVPGLLAGGPNPGQQDQCDYPHDEPARSYVDVWCSYASNEIAINWNAPLVYLAAALEALQAEAGYAVVR